MMRYCFGALFFIMISVFPALAEKTPPHVLYATDKVTIRTQKGEIPLTLEVASSSLQVMNGLMYRKSLAENSGMIFLFPVKGPVDMWMKNTYIPLDMFFIDEHGTIISIAENTIPESTDLIHSGGEVTGVIELAAGSAKRLNIAKGDKVLYPHFHE